MTSQSNLTRVISQVTPDERHRRNGHTGAVLWFTGLSASGKSTLAGALERELFDRGVQVVVLDGDNIRSGLSGDLTFSAGDRAENIRRVAEAARLFAEAGLVAITAFISPYREDRLRARRIVGESSYGIPFSEIYLDVALSICEQRDPKRLYARARKGEILDFTGVSAPYEIPENPDLAIATADCTVEAAVATIVGHVMPRIGQAIA